MKKYEAKATKVTKYNGTQERTLHVETTDEQSALSLMARKFKGYGIGKVKEVEKFDFEVETV